MEAMACGIPVVTTGYLPANRDNAWIVPVKNPTAIADAIADVFRDNDGRRARVNNALHDVAAFSWDRTAEKFIGLFNGSCAV